MTITGQDTVLDALNRSGGLTQEMLAVNIRLVRPAPPGTCCELILPVNLDAIVTKGDTTTNYQLLAGDRLVVYRDPADAPKAQDGPRTPEDVEARLRTVERKLDEVLKVLEKLPRP